MLYATLKEAISTDNQHSLDINDLTPNKNGYFLFAISQGDLDVARFLINGTKSSIERSEMINANNYQAFTTLLAEGKIEFLKFMMENIQPSQRHRPILNNFDLVLEHISESNSAEIIKFFVSITDFEVWESFGRYSRDKLNHEPTIDYLESLTLFVDAVKSNNEDNIKYSFNARGVTLDMVNKAIEWCKDNNQAKSLASLEDILKTPNTNINDGRTDSSDRLSSPSF